MTEEEKNEKQYEVKDKRRFNEDGSAKDNAAEEPVQSAGAAGQADGEAAGQAPGEEQEPPNVYGVLGFFMQMLVEQAWINMGKRVPPGMKQPPRDLTQAKLAIDVLSSVSEKLDPHIDDEEKKTLTGVISDLQVNFVNESNK